MIALWIRFLTICFVLIFFGEQSFAQVSVKENTSPESMSESGQAMLDSDSEKSWFLSFVEKKLSAPNRKIEISDITGVLSSKASIRQITISDNRGIWLKMSGIKLDWDRMALLTGRISVRSLIADKIEFLRKPIASSSFPHPESHDFSFPVLPVAIIIDQLKVKQILLNERVAQISSHMTFEGDLSLEQGRLDSHILLKRLDGAGGAMTFRADYNGGKQNLDFELSEPANGLLANWLNIDQRPAVHMSLKGGGNHDKFDLVLKLDIAERSALNGLFHSQSVSKNDEVAQHAGGVGKNAGTEFQLILDGTVSSFIPEIYRSFFGQKTKIRMGGLLKEKGGISLDQLLIEGGGGRIFAQGETAENGVLQQLLVSMNLEAAGDSLLVLPVKNGKTAVKKLVFDLNYGSEMDSWSGKLIGHHLTTDNLTIETMTMDMGGPIQYKNDPERHAVGIKIKGEGRGVSSPSAELSRTLGDQFQINLDMDWQRASQSLMISKIEAKAKELAILLSGKMQHQIFEGDIAAKIGDLALVSDFMDRSLSGQIDLKLRGKIGILSGSFDIILDGKGNKIGGISKQLDPFLKDQFVVSGQIGRDSGGIKTRNFTVASKLFTIASDGFFASERANLSLSIHLSDMGLLDPRMQGACQVKGSLRGDNGKFALEMRANAKQGKWNQNKISGVNLAVDGVLDTTSPVATDFDGSIDGSAIFAGEKFTLSARVGKIADQMVLNSLDMVLGQAKVRASMTKSENIFWKGYVSLKAQDISKLSALFFMKGKGKVETDMIFDVSGHQQTIRMKAQLNKMQLEQFTVGHLTLEGHLQDWSGLPWVEGALKGTDIGFDSYRMAVLNAKSQQQDGKANVSVNAVMGDQRNFMLVGAMVPLDRERWHISLDKVRLEQKNQKLTLQHPAQAIIHKNGVIDLQDFTLESKSGSKSGYLTVKGTLSDKNNVTLMINNFSLDPIGGIVDDLSLQGIINGEVNILGSRTQPLVRFFLEGEKIKAKLLENYRIGLLKAKAKGTIQDKQIQLDQFTLDAGAGNKGAGLRLNASGIVPLSAGGVNLNLDGTVNLGILDPILVPLGSQLSGMVTLKTTVKESWKQPVLSGDLTVRDGKWQDFQTDMKLDKIGISGKFQGNRFVITHGEAHAAGGGALGLSGWLSTNIAEGMPANLQLRLHQFYYQNHQLLTATLGGLAQITGPLLKNPEISGDIVIEKAEVNIAENYHNDTLLKLDNKNAPAAVMKTIKRAIGEKSKVSKNSSSLKPNFVPKFNLLIRAPNPVFVRGRGLDAVLRGQIRLVGPINKISPVGAFTMERGNFTILGQRLQFQEGQISLVGNLDPILNFVAVANNRENNIKITIQGTAKKPEISFTSQSDLPQDEILARFIFNRSISELSPFQIVRLAGAMAELSGISNGTFLGGGNFHSGLDQFNITTDSQGKTAIEAGHYIRDNLYLGVETSLGGETKGTINLDIGPNITTKGTVGAKSDSSLGIFYDKDY